MGGGGGIFEGNTSFEHVTTCITKSMHNIRVVMTEKEDETEKKGGGGGVLGSFVCM